MRSHTAQALAALAAAATSLLAPVRADDAVAEYDFVVVGGGTSGLTVADRLTEDPAGGQFVFFSG